MDPLIFTFVGFLIGVVLCALIWAVLHLFDKAITWLSRDQNYDPYQDKDNWGGF